MVAARSPIVAVAAVENRRRVELVALYSAADTM